MFHSTLSYNRTLEEFKFASYNFLTVVIETYNRTLEEFKLYNEYYSCYWYRLIIVP